MKKRKNMLLALLVSASMIATPLAQIPVFAEEAVIADTEAAAEETEDIIIEEADLTDDAEATAEAEPEVEIEVTETPEAEDAVYAATTEVTNLTASSLTAMFKAVSGSIEKTGNSTVLRFALSGTGYQDIFVGTYEEANATTSGASIDSSNWIHYSLNAAGKYEFVIPIEEGQTFIPICGLSASKAAAGEYKWYPRQLTIDYQALTLVSDDYNHTVELALTNENQAFAAAAAGLTTVGGPNSNNYKEILQLTMEDADLDAAYIGTADEAAAAASVITIDANNTFSIPVLANKMGGAVDYDYMDQDTVIAFRNAADGSWTEETILVSKTAGTACIRSKALEIVTQPVDAYGFIGDSISFSVEAKNVASYQWYYCKDGVRWFKSSAAGAKSNTLTLKVSSTNTETRYACYLTGLNGERIVSDVVMNAQDQLYVSAEASPVADNKTVTFKATSTLDNVSYQWYYSKNGGTSWFKSSASTAKTKVLTIKASSTNIGTLYRCKVSVDSRIYAFTEAVSYKVPTITAQPEMAGTDQAKGTFSVTVENDDNCSYQWYYSKNGGQTWFRSSATGAKTPEIKVSVNFTSIYRCEITTNWGYKLVSDSAGFQK